MLRFNDLKPSSFNRLMKNRNNIFIEPPPPELVVAACLTVVRVVDLKRSETPPMVKVVWVKVPSLAEDVCFTLTVSPSLSVVETVVKSPLFMLNIPPVMLIAVGTLIPLTVMVLEVISEVTATAV